MSTKHSLFLAIEAVLEEQCAATGVSLNEENRTFIASTLWDHTWDSIDKYLAGQKEHGGDFLLKKTHKQELRKELIDIMWYSAADEYDTRL